MRGEKHKKGDGKKRGQEFQNKKGKKKVMLATKNNHSVGENASPNHQNRLEKKGKGGRKSTWGAKRSGGGDINCSDHN